jgi:hypothetical protein
MSEKIYACLLRLFPSAFRRYYEEEALRLLRDRLRDEPGFLRRLRLSFELIADMIGALPQAYKNSYAEAAPAAPLAPHFDGVPSFQVLEREPIRRGAIVFAGFLSLTALATFTYVLDRSIQSHPAAQNHPISPIEAVLQHLNQPISPDSADSERSDASASAPADTGRPVSATGAESQPAHSSQDIADARRLDHNSAAAVVEPSSPASVDQRVVQSQPEAIRVAARSAGPFNMQAPTGVAADLSGEWTLRIARGDAAVPRRFIFRQEGAELNGTGGPDSTEQYPIIHGLVTGNSLRFELNDGRRRFLYNLMVQNQEIRGTLSVRRASEVRVTTVWLERNH